MTIRTVYSKEKRLLHGTANNNNNNKTATKMVVFAEIRSYEGPFSEKGSAYCKLVEIPQQQARKKMLGETQHLYRLELFLLWHSCLIAVLPKAEDWALSTQFYVILKTILRHTYSFHFTLGDTEAESLATCPPVMILYQGTQVCALEIMIVPSLLTNMVALWCYLLKVQIESPRFEIQVFGF